MYHPNLSALRTLLSGISLPKTDEEGGGVIVAVTAPPPAADPSPVWTTRLASLSKMQGDGKIVPTISGMLFVACNPSSPVCTESCSFHHSGDGTPSFGFACYFLVLLVSVRDCILEYIILDVFQFHDRSLLQSYNHILSYCSVTSQWKQKEDFLVGFVKYVSKIHF